MMRIKTILRPHEWVNALFDPNGVQGAERWPLGRGRAYGAPQRRDASER
jgi:hypothetical protein